MIFYLQRCDLDGDGFLNYSEFTTLMFRQKERKEKRAEEKIPKERRKEPKSKKKKEMVFHKASN